MKKTILIIEDDETQRVLLESFLRAKMHLHSYMAENGRRALEILAEKKPIELIISDIEMPVMDGIETLRHIRESFPTLPVIMLTGSKNMDHAVEAMRLGAADFVSKPYDQQRMRVTIQNVMKMRSMTNEIIRLQDDLENRFLFEHMIGHDGGLKDVIQLGRKASMVDLPTLITGETGTGKELFAKAIHGESGQSGGPFITVNCGAIPSELVESTLFGHEKGAFTGATQASIGKFREADGGTIFLDEIGELPREAQTKLLRVLQEKEVEPVGAARAVKVNVRVVSATHRNLEDDVKNGLFREDLYYRLNVLGMHIPPLRERDVDIESLTEYLIRKITIQASVPLKAVSKKTQKFFQNYSWPGNVRQMENVINRAVILSDNMTLEPEDFNLTSVPDDDSSAEIPRQTTQFQTIAEMENAMMRDALDKFDNNITQAAKALGIAKSTFYRKMKSI